MKKVPTKAGRPAASQSWVQQQPELFSSRAEIKREVSRALGAGLIRRLAPRLYTRNLVDAPETLIRRHVWDVIAALSPAGAVVSHRTAFEGQPSGSGDVWLTASYPRVIRVPGLTIHLVAGHGRLPGDMPYAGTLVLASQARHLLENLLPTRTRGGSRRAVGRVDVEERLETVLRSQGEAGLNRLRDQARDLAPALQAQEAFEVLDRVIGSLLGTREARAAGPLLRARQAGIPYDTGAIRRVDLLMAELLRAVPGDRPDHTRSGPAWDNLAFFDAYFSNYIEGTTFEVDEAEAIVFQGQIPDRRPADAHDVLGTYRFVCDAGEMARGMSDLSSTEAVLERIRRCNATILQGRPDMRPGSWKAEPNRAGESQFVPPELVEGTLVAGLERIRGLPAPMQRACGLMFLLTEVHPFKDGNGRVARALMNAELVAGGQRRILIPTVYREDYLGALRELTRRDRPGLLLPMLERAQEVTAAIDFADLGAARGALASANAFRDWQEARLRIPGRLG